jgi:hypothetical protein
MTTEEERRLWVSVGKAVSALPGDLVLYLLDPDQRAEATRARSPSLARAVITASANVMRVASPEARS